MWSVPISTGNTPHAAVQEGVDELTCREGEEGALRSLRAYSELAATKGKGHGLGPPGIAAFTGLLQALSERGSTVGAANTAGVAKLQANVGRHLT